MPEAITKYAINSTLGTEKFKPLDVLIADKFTENLGVAASDTPLKVLVSSPIRLYDISVSENVGSFVANTNGTVRIEAYFFDDGKYPGSTAEFWVVDNDGTRIGRIETDEFFDTPKKFFLDINVSKGKTYGVRMVSDRISASCNSLKVCGSSIHSTLIS